MSKLIEGMARAAWPNVDAEDLPFMQERIGAALLWLADNISQDILDAAGSRLPHAANLAEVDVEDAIAAALRQAAGETK